MGHWVGKLLVGQRHLADEVWCEWLAAGRQFVLRTTPVIRGVSRFLGQTGRQAVGAQLMGRR